MKEAQRAPLAPDLAALISRIRSCVGLLRLSGLNVSSLPRAWSVAAFQTVCAVERVQLPLPSILYPSLLSVIRGSSFLSTGDLCLYCGGLHGRHAVIALPCNQTLHRLLRSPFGLEGIFTTMANSTITTTSGNLKILLLAGE